MLKFAFRQITNNTISSCFDYIDNKYIKSNYLQNKPTIFKICLNKSIDFVSPIVSSQSIDLSNHDETKINYYESKCPIKIIDQIKNDNRNETIKYFDEIKLNKFVINAI